MTERAATATNRPAWVDLSTPDVAASRAFYERVLGWQVEVSPDPAYGGYGIARIGGKDVAGIGPKQSPEQPTVWSLYIGTDDAADLAARVQRAGGTVIGPPFPVGDQGTMAIFQDPAGAFISAWQADTMHGFQATGAGAYGWAELNARGVDRALPFYAAVFGWTTRTSDMGEGNPPYVEFLAGADSVAGAWEMNPAIPPEVPSYWMVYFNVDDVDAAFRRGLDAGASEMMAPQDFPGGRFAIIGDPHGATLGLLRLSA